MPLIVGTNCGFVLTAPTADPASAATFIVDDKCVAMEAIAPVGATKITEIGWWSDLVTEESNYEIGLFSDAGASEPELLLSVDRTNAKGTDAGWKVKAVDWDIVGETTYWLALQVDDTPTATRADADTAQGNKSVLFAPQTELPSDWGTGTNTVGLIALYALYTPGGNVVPLAAVISAAGGIEGSAGVERRLSGAIAGSGGVSPASQVQRALLAVLAGLGNVSGTAKVDRSLIAVLAGAGGLAGTLSVAKLNALAGVIAAGGNVAGAVRVARQVLAVIAGQGGLTGTLKTNWALAGMVGGRGSIAGSLSGVAEGDDKLCVNGSAKGTYTTGRGVSKRRVKL